MKIITFYEYWGLSPQERDNFTGIAQGKTGHVEYRKNGKYHREDGPAVTLSNGSEIWYFEGKQHRIGGPASIDKTFNKGYYYIYGQECTKEAHDLWVDLVKMKEMKSKNKKEKQ